MPRFGSTVMNPDAPVIRAPLAQDLVARYNADLVIVAMSSLQQPKLRQTVREVLAAHTGVSFVPSNFLQPDSWVDSQDIDGVLLASEGKSEAPRL
jgi:hypothetical protein